MNTENSRTSKYHVLVLKLTDELDLRRGKKKCCFMKSWYLLYIEKYKRVIQ